MVHVTLLVVIRWDAWHENQNQKELKLRMDVVDAILQNGHTPGDTMTSHLSKLHFIAEKYFVIVG